MRKVLPLTIILFLASMKVNAQCDAAFTFSVSPFGTAQFQATNTGAALQHVWLFSDGGIGFSPSISHNYHFNGTYTVTHILTDSSNQCSDTVQHVITVAITVTCQSNFSVVRDSSDYLRYHFQAFPMVTGDTVISYQWTVNGVPLALSTSAFSQLFTPGVLHIICLKIVTATGCNSSQCHTLLFSAQPPCNLSASFTAIASSSIPRQFSFVPAPSSNSLHYNWNFGDGHSSTQANPVHTYSQAGTYNVRLIITDTIPGCSDSVWQNLQVHGTPSDSCTAFFSYTANPAQPNQISFTAVSNQTITSQTWVIYTGTVNDTMTITANNPTYTFTDSGSYYVCFYLTTNTGCSDSFCWLINIDSIPGQQGGRIPSYPNPATNIINLRLQLEHQDRIGITIYNMSGNVVYKIEKQGHRGSNEINIPVQQLNAGQYFIDIRYGDQRKRSIFQKF